MFVEKWGLTAGCGDCGLVGSGRIQMKWLLKEWIGRRFSSETVQEKEWQRTWCCACSWCGVAGKNKRRSPKVDAFTSLVTGGSDRGGGVSDVRHRCIDMI